MSPSRAHERECERERERERWHRDHHSINERRRQLYDPAGPPASHIGHLAHSFTLRAATSVPNLSTRTNTGSSACDRSRVSTAGAPGPVAGPGQGREQSQGPCSAGDIQHSTPDTVALPSPPPPPPPRSQLRKSFSRVFERNKQQSPVIEPPLPELAPQLRHDQLSDTAASLDQQGLTRKWALARQHHSSRDPSPIDERRFSERTIVPPSTGIIKPDTTPAASVDDMAARGNDTYAAGQFGELKELGDRQDTLRALEGVPRNLGRTVYSESARTSRHSQSHGREQSTGDLFLDLARDGLETTEEQGDSLPFTVPGQRKSRAAQASNIHRTSLQGPHSPTLSQVGRTMSSHRTDDVLSSPRTQRPSSRQSVSTAVPSYQPMSYDTPSAASAHPLNSHSTTSQASVRSTPMGSRSSLGYKEFTFESQLAYPSRRSDKASRLPARPQPYRQSGLSREMPRSYATMPTLSTQADSDETPHVRQEGTISSDSTNDPSTVWDELDELKSRIHRLELTGKPTNSTNNNGTGLSERPPTATTAASSVSMSPKPERSMSIPSLEKTRATLSGGDGHPLLHSALAKTKPLVSVDVYDALFSTASDALSIVGMMGGTIQQATVSSSQSTLSPVGLGASPTIVDRQLRRKADSLCRSLTELCITLAGQRAAVAGSTPSIPRASTCNALVRLQETVQSSPLQQQTLNDAVLTASTATSPRALSRLQARRASLAGMSTHLGPKYSPGLQTNSIIETPLQGTSDRRASLFQRMRRSPMGRQADDDEPSLRAPSRAATEMMLRVSSLGLPRRIREHQSSDRESVMQSIERPSIECETPEDSPLSQHSSRPNVHPHSALPRPGRRYFSSSFPIGVSEGAPANRNETHTTTLKNTPPLRLRASFVSSSPSGITPPSAARRFYGRKPADGVLLSPRSRLEEMHAARRNKLRIPTLSAGADYSAESLDETEGSNTDSVE